MASYTFTPGGNSAFASLVKNQNGGAWRTVRESPDATSVTNGTTTEIVMRSRKAGSSWNNYRGFLYFDFSDLPSAIIGMRLNRLTLTFKVTNASAGDTDGNKFRLFSLDAENSGFDAVVGDYNGFRSPRTKVLEIDSTGANKSVQITDVPFLRSIEKRINKKQDIHLMMRNLYDITGTPTSTNNLTVHDPKTGTAGDRPRMTLHFTPYRPGTGTTGTGFGGATTSAAAGTGFNTF